MAIIKCPDCGQDVSERATVCIHCGAPLNAVEKNGEVMIKFPHYASGRNVAEIWGVNGKIRLKEGMVVSVQIDKDTPVTIFIYDTANRCAKPYHGILKYEGKHCYEIVEVRGLIFSRPQLNEVTNIGSM